ncbi:ATP-grasp fold amidoligase family protein [Sporosarcina aquimarina]|uniref:ATP-grasp fold amidoligase family protein n=1 Tax=Sporosarcina aquimarina TaxID=114975 RepID=A0ABU4G132_9BACL|nr:ATP-grasp fold amidoligase family protein [Sporosarcina aquimarina]MDW0110676.1 ATP-grasp fold amidoligase family protein [Sporosarcina aquimarina]
MRTKIIRFLRVVPDELYLKLLFYKNLKYGLNLEDPITYNEKLQWLKMNDRQSFYPMLVDKVEVRKHIAEILGEQYVVPLIGVWDDANDIEFEKLPNKFVLKCNHDSKSVIVCTDKRQLDFRKTVKKLEKGLKQNAYWYGREWPYKSVRPRVLAEKYIEDHNTRILRDYKVVCFHGKAHFIQVHFDRGTPKYHQDLYDMNWNLVFMTQGVKDLDMRMANNYIEKPGFFDEMVRLSEQLASDMIHVRVDWYYANGQLYFGEMTFYDGSGFIPFDNWEDDVTLGNLMDLKV